MRRADKMFRVLYTPMERFPGLLSHFLNIQSHLGWVRKKSCLSSDFAGAISLTLERWGGVKARQQPWSRHTGVFVYLCMYVCVCGVVWCVCRGGGGVYLWILNRKDSSRVTHCIFGAHRGTMTNSWLCMRDNHWTCTSSESTLHTNYVFLSSFWVWSCNHTGKKMTT